MNIKTYKSEQIFFKGQRENENLYKEYNKCVTQLIYKSYPKEIDEGFKENCFRSLEGLNNAVDEFIRCEDSYDYPQLAVGTEEALVKLSEYLIQKSNQNKNWVQPVKEMLNTVRDITSKIGCFIDTCGLKELVLNQIEEESSQQPVNVIQPLMLVPYNQGLPSFKPSAENELPVVKFKKTMAERELSRILKHLSSLDKKPYFKYDSTIDIKEPYYALARRDFKNKKFISAEANFCKELTSLRKQLGMTAEKVPIILRMANTFKELGDTYQELNKKNLAEELYDNAIFIYSRISDTSDAEINKMLTEVIMQQKDLYVSRINSTLDLDIRDMYKSKLNNLDILLHD